MKPDKVLIQLVCPPVNVIINLIVVVFHNLIVVSHDPDANISSFLYEYNVWIKSEWPIKLEYVWNELFVILIELSSKLLANLFPSLLRLTNAKLIPNGCIISDLHVNEFNFEHSHKYSLLFDSNCLHPSHGKFQQLLSIYHY